jgi:5'-methylthioadenosine phosphorylase
MAKVKVGIIGGSGLDDPKILAKPSIIKGITKYGKTSSPLLLGKIKGVDVAILARHGKDHSVSPTNINFQANIFALKKEGCSHILATSAVGSLRKEINPGNLAFPSQVIDFTKLRKLTFFHNKVVHTPMSEPFDKNLRSILCKSCETLKFEYKNDVTLVTIEGPRFSTKAESHMFRSLNADIINMSTCPEVFLANELNIPYQVIAMSTDYDCWKEDEDPVTFEMVMKRMKENANKVKKLLVDVIPKIKT